MELMIGNVKLNNPVVVAPMAGVTDKAFRMITGAFGCGLIYTEMISVNALAFDSQRTRKMFDLTGETSATGIQIFGSDPDRMAAAAVEAKEAGAAIIDINMGCPAPKIVKNLEGCSLMTNLPLAAKIIEKVVNAVDTPVTVKMRKGWDEDSLNAVELSKIAESCGAAAVTIHGRTRNQYYSGQADWEYIGRVKAAIGIPVIGNGDIKCPRDAEKMMRQTGCDGVMIGRAAMGNPWLIGRTVAFLEKRQDIPEPNFREKITLALQHLQLEIQFKGESRGIREMRKHIAWYLKGLRDSTRIRETINKAVSYEELTEVLNQYLIFLEQSELQHD